MRRALISDLHANLEALEAVCRAGAERGVEAWICLGDIVGYGADPAPCLERTRMLSKQTVLGNHDAAVAARLDPAYFNECALRALEWTAAQLSPSERAYLAELPLKLECDRALCVHAGPCAPESWDYIETEAQVRAAFAAAGVRLCFIGHSHRPFVCAWSGTRCEWVARSGRMQMRPERSYLVNVGSVGQPRDGDPRACFLLWDDEGEALEFVRVDYDIAAAQEKILRAGLPAFLARRLACGR